MTLEAQYHAPNDTVRQNASEKRSPGEVLKLPDDRAAFRSGNRAAASGDDYAAQVGGVQAKIQKDSSSFSFGDDVYFDASADQATALDNALDGSADFHLGKCVQEGGAASGDSDVLVEMNTRSRYEQLRPFVFEFDCSTAGDTDDHTLIPAEQNPHGLWVKNIFGRVTEAFGGGTEDQGIITVEDEDDNSLGTLTAADAGADSVDDIILGNNNIEGGSSGDAGKFVAAGKAVTGRVSQQTSGSSEAGKMTVFVDAVPSV